jgi:hypothetical protein
VFCLLALCFLIFSLAIPRALAGCEIVGVLEGQPNNSNIILQVHNKDNVARTITVWLQYDSKEEKTNEQTIPAGATEQVVVPKGNLRTWTVVWRDDRGEKGEVVIDKEGKITYTEIPEGGFSTALYKEDISLSSIALYSTVLLAGATTTICINRSRHGKERQ